MGFNSGFKGLKVMKRGVFNTTRKQTVPSHPRHQSAATWVSTARYSKYSQVLLMMGENIARNMQS